MGFQISVKQERIFHPAGSSAEKTVRKTGKLYMARANQQDIHVIAAGLEDPLIGGDNRMFIHNNRVALGISLRNMDFAHIADHTVKVPDPYISDYG